MREVADLGCIVEFTWISAFPMWRDLDPMKVAETARALGPERCVMSTDAQLDLNPPPTEMLRMFIATMLRLGFEEEEIRWMGPAKSRPPDGTRRIEINRTTHPDG